MKLQGQKKTKIILALSVFCAIFSTGSSAFAADNVMNIDADTAISSTINVAAGDTLTVNGNGHTLTRNSGFTGSLFSVAEGATLTINSLFIDGGAPDWTSDFDDLQVRWNSSQTYSYAIYGIETGENDIVVNTSMIVNKGTLSFNHSQINNCLTNTVSPGITNSGTLTVTDGSFKHNAILASHGGVIRSTAGSATINSSSFRINSAGDATHFHHGGAIYASGGSLTINESSFAGNSAEGVGGAIYAPGAELSISESTFDDNKAGQSGTAVYFGGTDGERTATFKNNKFTNNIALPYYTDTGVDDGCGAVAYRNKGFTSISIEGDEYTGNIASIHAALSIAGAADNYIPLVTLKNLTMSNNKTNRSGAIAEVRRTNEIVADNIDMNHNEGNFGFWQYGTATATNINITDNDWNGSVAMFWIHEGESATLSNINISGNSTGALLSRNQKKLVIDSLTASNNTSLTNGIVIIYNVDDATVSNSSITNNEAYGSGLRLASAASFSDGKATFNSVTVTGNHSNLQGAGVRIEDRSRRAVFFDDDSVILNNKAENGGDDIYITAEEDGAVLKEMTLPSQLFYYSDPRNSRFDDGYREYVSADTLKEPRYFLLKALTEKQPENPPTGDNITVWIGALSFSLVLGVAVCRKQLVR